MSVMFYPSGPVWKSLVNHYSILNETKMMVMMMMMMMMMMVVVMMMNVMIMMVIMID